MNRTVSAVLVLLAAAGPASAHHGIANFDLNKDIELEGTVTQVEFLNPHSWLQIEVTDANGERATWRCEMRGATVLRRCTNVLALLPRTAST